jgi:hypothetical protein
LPKSITFYEALDFAIDERWEEKGTTSPVSASPYDAVTTTALHSRPPLRRYACGMVASK